MNQLPEHIGGYQHIEPDILVCKDDILVNGGKPVHFSMDSVSDMTVGDLEAATGCNVYRKLACPGSRDDKQQWGEGPAKSTRSCVVCNGGMEHKQKGAIYCSDKCKHRSGKVKEMERYHSNPLDRERHLQRSREYSRANPEKNRARASAWKKANPERARVWSRKKQGMINPPGHRKDGPCESCGNVEPLVLDHDHKTGQIRGWLCGCCNRSLGQAKDSILVLQSLITYLTKFK